MDKALTIASYIVTGWLMWHYGFTQSWKLGLIMLAVNTLGFSRGYDVGRKRAMRAENLNLQTVGE